MQKRIFVLDADQRSALAVVRSLGKLDGVSVDCGDSPAEALSSRSRYIENYWQYPSIKEKPLKFINWLTQHLAQRRYDYIFPITEISSQLLLRHSELLGAARIPFINLETLMKLADKGQLVELAQQLNVKTPESQIIKSPEAVDSRTIERYPVVIKPCLSHIWCKDHWLSTQVQIAYSRDELEDYLNKTKWLKSYPFMLQEFIRGHGEGLFAIYDHGRPVAFFQHRRIREKPPEGGVSVVCESVPLSEKLLQPAQELLNGCNWHGVAMVEFRVAENGTPYLMEVNTRFWGSLQLAIDAGVDFPKLLLEVCDGKHPQLLRDYRSGIRMRWLLGDIDSLYLTLKSPHYNIWQKLRAIGKFCTPDPFGTYHQVNRWNDLKPAWTELKRYMKF